MNICQTRSVLLLSAKWKKKSILLGRSFAIIHVYACIFFLLLCYYDRIFRSRKFFGAKNYVNCTHDRGSCNLSCAQDTCNFNIKGGFSAGAPDAFPFLKTVKSSLLKFFDCITRINFIVINMQDLLHVLIILCLITKAY